jgi:tetratricopeptide (TPR) repeat protein
MKKYLFTTAVFCLLCTGNLFSQTANELRETARSFLQQSDFSNAILVLNRALQMEPKNIDIIKDLSLAYYFQKDNARALEIIKPILDGEDADDQCYQIAGNIYKQLEQTKESEKLFRRGIKKFPASGAMYNELGEILWTQQDYSAIKQWEKGIQVDPGFSTNYFNASKFYYLSTDKVWSILYGEIFINIEPNSSKSAEIKGIVLEGYKKLFVETDLSKPAEGAGEFEKAFLQIMNKQSNIAAGGINAESLTMIRTRFILDWYSLQKEAMPFRLFEQQRQLLQEGMFDAYNQWIFGAAQNLTAYQNWVSNNKTAHQEFIRFQQGRVFKIPAGQYYHQ